MKPLRNLLVTCLCGTVVLTLSACGAFHQKDFPKDGPSFKATANPMKVTKQDLGHSWPFDDVAEVTVSCKKDGDDVILRATLPDGKEYALNSVEGNTDLTPIEDRANESVGTLRAVAFDTCDIDGK
nr:superoxide dismutase [Actinomyces sp. UMB0138]